MANKTIKTARIKGYKDRRAKKAITDNAFIYLEYLSLLFISLTLCAMRYALCEI